MCRRPYTSYCKAVAGLWSRFGPGSRIEPGLGPGRLRARAAEHDPVMQAERPVLPKLDLERDEPVAAPIGGARHLAAGEALGQARHLGLERRAARKRARLARGASADPALAMAGDE